MAIASPSTPSFSVSFGCKRATASCDFNRFTQFPSIAFTRPHHLKSLSCVKPPSNTSSLSSSSSSQVGDEVMHQLQLISSSQNDDEEFMHQLQLSGWQEGAPVFVKLPVDLLDPTAERLLRAKLITFSLRALAVAGVTGVVMEVWWGLVEREDPGVYNWKGYMEVIKLAALFGLKVRAVMAFHQFGTGPADPYWISLPHWVLEEIKKNPDLAHCDRFGRRSMEYISLGCDTLPVLRGRSPIQAYADFMRDFRDTFKPWLGVTITGIQVGMGPAGELRYPSCPSEKLTWAWRSRELGEFQCYDKYMLASLTASARAIGLPGWGERGPIDAGTMLLDPERTDFFKSNNGKWNTPYGKFFLQWYSGMLLLHGERICKEAEAIFRGTDIITSAKVAGIYWHYRTMSHPSELTAGYYNTSSRDGYLPIACMFGRHGFAMCCTGFEMQDVTEEKRNLRASPEGLLRHLLWAARVCDVFLEGETHATTFDDESFKQILKMFEFYSRGLGKNTISFNFGRMDKNLFHDRHFASFVGFVKIMSNPDTFRSNLGPGGDVVKLSSSAGFGKIGTAFAFC